MAKPRFIALLLLVLLVGGFSTGRAREEKPSAQSELLVRITPEQAGVFADALTSLSQQARVAFVVEGEPLKGTRTDKEVEDVPREEAPLSSVVTRLAAAYDYDTERQGDVFVFKKRYTEPDDLPGVTVAECVLVMKDVLRFVSAFSPDLANPCPRDPQVKRFIASLTDAQLQAMKDKKLTVASLSPQQQGVVWKLALNFHLSYPKQRAKTTVDQLSRLSPEGIVFCWSDRYAPRSIPWHAPRLFGYETASASSSRPSFRPLVDPRLVTVEPNGGFSIVTHEIRNGKPVPLSEAYDRTEPPAGKAAESKTAPTISSTLEAVVAALNARTADAPRMAVDAALAAKPIRIIGADAAQPPALLKAMADAYGLRIRTEKDGTLTLTRKLVRSPRTLSDLPEAVRDALPEPLRRALRVGSGAPDDPKTAFMPSPSQQQQAVQSPHSRDLGKHHRSQETPDPLRLVAVRRLRTGIEPKLKQAPNGRVSLSALDGPEQVAFANVLMADCLSDLRRLSARELPKQITQFDKLVLFGGLYLNDEGEQKFSLFLGLPAADGKNVSVVGGGFSNVAFVR